MSFERRALTPLSIASPSSALAVRKSITCPVACTPASVRPAPVIRIGAAQISVSARSISPATATERGQPAPARLLFRGLSGLLFLVVGHELDERERRVVTHATRKARRPGVTRRAVRVALGEVVEDLVHDDRLGEPRRGAAP